MGSEGSKESMDGVDYGLKLDESPSQCFFRPLSSNVCAVCRCTQSMLTDGVFRCRKFLPSVFSAHLFMEELFMEELSWTAYYTLLMNPWSYRVIYMFLDSMSNCQLKDNFCTCET